MDNGFFQRFFATLERSLSWLESLLKAVFLGVLTAVVLLNFDVITSGFRGLAQKLPLLVEVNALGVGAKFSPAEINRKVKYSEITTSNLRAFYGPEQAANASEGLKSLDKKGLVRIMNVGLLKNICQFEKPNADILSDNATDKALEEKRLVRIIQNPAQTETVRSQIKRNEIATHKPSDIGYPVSCYDIELTNRGYDVRTAVVQAMGARFEPDVAE
ncbi:hypothetical protein [Methylocystis sp. ATCC 49242]|uniref:hypothetical protein n=1 Tax=Methylocystis sp. ATCC 49242 TaxID=622637 RepID=UPI0001F87E6C|nr:hypothetical protein [Methylocystis sp. ATCC 49242]